MKKVIIFLIGIYFLQFTLPLLAADEIDLQFVIITNDGSDFEVKIQCKRNNSNWDKLGDANFAFYFNTSGLDNPTLSTAHNFSGTLYSAMTVTDNTNYASVNIELLVADLGTAVGTGWMDVATVHFDVLNSSLTSGLSWRTDAAYAGFDDDNTTPLDPGSFTNLDVSLPVLMSNFEALIIQNAIQINWTTASELQNIGFHVLRSDNSDGPYVQITNDIIAGEGNSSSGAEYKYFDTNVTNNSTYWYQIVSVSTSGDQETFGPISVIAVNVIPEEFALSQNFPNPFNPKTDIKYEVPENAYVNISIYNMLGQKIKTLVDTQIEPGYHSVTWHGTNDAGQSVGTGIYVVKISTEEFTAIRKMMLMR